MRSPTFSERVERSSTGQLIISAFVVLLLLCEIGTNLPPSAIQAKVLTNARRVNQILLVEQEWGVFAPDPRSASLKLEARVAFADGSNATWHLPDGSPIGSNLRYYRWRKWLERVRSDDYSDIWDTTARWIASLYEDRRSPVVKVQLVRRFHENSLSGEQPPYRSFVYYTLDLEEDEP